MNSKPLPCPDKTQAASPDWKIDFAQKVRCTHTHRYIKSLDEDNDSIDWLYPLTRTYR